MRKPLVTALLSLLFLLPFTPSHAQSGDAGGSTVLAGNTSTTSAVNAGESENVARANSWTVGVVGGLLEGSFLRFAADLGQALDDGENMRVLPIVSYRAVDNLNDLISQHGIDIAITNADVFSEFKKPDIEKHINYISPMYVSEVHIFARPEIKTIADLAGKTVSLGNKGAGQTITGPIILDRLGVKANIVFTEAEASLEKMKTGEIAAVIQNAGKPSPLFAKLKAEPGFHFLSVPYGDKFFDYYVPSTLTKDDYPNIIGEGETVQTIGVPAVLAVYNWPKGTDRYRKVERFIQYYFERFDKLRYPPFHPKWKEIDLAAKVPGWTRYSVAEDMLAKRASKVKELEAARNEPASPGSDAAEAGGSFKSAAEQDKFFQEFLQWRRTHGR